MSPDATFSIGELAARTGLTPDALRYYERLRVIAPVRRTAGGYRVYTAETIGGRRIQKFEPVSD